MPASRHTLLRQVTKAARGSGLQPKVRVLGVVEKGQSFGTILVDLERSEVADLLPNRSAKASQRLAGTTSRSGHGNP
jgi:hypothetical protein